jgi:hypothetical protein
MMQTNSIIQPNRPRKMTPHQDDWDSMGGFATTATYSSLRPQWQPESEIAQLQTEVFAATGIKVSEDDPILAVLVTQKRHITEYTQQLQQQHSEQQEIFLTQFKIQVQAVTQAAESLAEQKQYLLGEIIRANDAYLQDVENKLMGSVATKMRNQAIEEQDDFFGSLKRLLMISGCLFLLAQLVLLGAFLLLK